MLKIYIENIGCARRALDAQKLKNYFETNGQAIVYSPEKADYLFLFSCGLVKKEDLSLKRIKKLDKTKGKLVVCGCLPPMNPDKLNIVFKGKSINTRELNKIDDIFPQFAVKFNQIPDANKAFNLPNEIKLSKREKLLKKTTVFGFLKEIADKEKKIKENKEVVNLRISYGCMGNCSYCAIKKAIGTLESKKPKTILKEARKSLKKNCYKFNIISSDSGSYGLDIGTSLPSLLEKILNLDNRITIEFIQDLHPAYICKYKKELIKLVKSQRIKSILTAVQSGDERLLRLMDRPTNLKKYKDTLTEMKKTFPKLELKTQIIVGFPSETEKDFERTLNFIKDCNFDDVGIFPYYENKYVRSAKIKPKVPKDVIKKRVKKAKTFFGQRIYKVILNKIK